MAPKAVAPSLGAAGSFAALGASAVTNTGPTVLNGDLGISPNNASSITGFPPGLVTGVVHAADAVALQAQNDTTTAYNILAGQACDFSLTGQDLGGLTLTPGVYCFSTSAQLTGALTLNAQGDPNAVWVFRIGSTLTTASASSVAIINGGSPCNVFWQVGSSATLGTTTQFEGNILALQSVALNTGANLIGRVLARNAAVTLDTNNVSFATRTAIPPKQPCYSQIPIPNDRLVSYLAPGPDGQLWFSESMTTTPPTYRIARLTQNGIAEFPVSSIGFMTAGPDANLWYASQNPGSVTRVTPTGTATIFPIVGNEPTHITAGPDGNLWIAETQTNQIERVTTGGSVTGQFPLLTADSYPGSLVLGPDGNLWFVEGKAKKIGRIDMSGNITEFDPLPLPPDPSIYSSEIGRIAAGVDGNLWFTELVKIIPYDGYSYINRMTPSGTITRFPQMERQLFIGDLVTAADGYVWGRLYSARGLDAGTVRIADNGNYTLVAPYPGVQYGKGIAALGDGTIWLGADHGVRGLVSFHTKTVENCSYYYLPFTPR